MFKKIWRVVYANWIFFFLLVVFIIKICRAKKAADAKEPETVEQFPV